jgi:hypothetical protein
VGQAGGLESGQGHGFHGGGGRWFAPKLSTGSPTEVIDWLWRRVKYEGVDEAHPGLAQYFRFYNTACPHLALGYPTAAEVHFGSAGIGCDHVTDSNKKGKKQEDRRCYSCRILP